MTAICDLIVIFIDSPRYNNYRREVERVGGAEALCVLENHGSRKSAFDAPREMKFSADSCLRSSFTENIGVFSRKFFEFPFFSAEFKNRTIFSAPSMSDDHAHTFGQRRHHLDDSFESHKALDYNNVVVRFIATQTSSRLLRE